MPDALQSDDLPPGLSYQPPPQAAPADDLPPGLSYKPPAATASSDDLPPGLSYRPPPGGVPPSSIHSDRLAAMQAQPPITAPYGPEILADAAKGTGADVLNYATDILGHATSAPANAKLPRASGGQMQEGDGPLTGLTAGAENAMSGITDPRAAPLKVVGSMLSSAAEGATSPQAMPLVIGAPLLGALGPAAKAVSALFATQMGKSFIEQNAPEIGEAYEEYQRTGNPDKLLYAIGHGGSTVAMILGAATHAVSGVPGGLGAAGDKLAGIDVMDKALAPEAPQPREPVPGLPTIPEPAPAPNLTQPDWYPERPKGGSAEFPKETLYRTRAVGEEGIPFDPERHGPNVARATTSLDEAKRYADWRKDTTGKPQEIVSFLEPDGSTIVKSPDGNPWYGLSAEVPEADLKTILSAHDLGHIGPEDVSTTEAAHNAQSVTLTDAHGNVHEIDLSDLADDRAKAGESAGGNRVAPGGGEAEGHGYGDPENQLAAEGNSRFNRGKGPGPDEVGGPAEAEPVRGNEGVAVGDSEGGPETQEGPLRDDTATEPGRPDQLTHRTINDLQSAAGQEPTTESRFKRGFAETNAAVDQNLEPLTRRALAAKPGELLSEEVRAAGVRHLKELVENGDPADLETIDKLSNTLYEASSALGRGLNFSKSLLDPLDISDGAAVVDTAMKATKGKLSVQAKADLADMSRRAKVAKEKVEQSVSEKAEAALARIEAMGNKKISAKDILNCRG